MNNDYDLLFDQLGKKFDVDPKLIKTIFHVESGGDPNVRRGSSGEMGPFQIMPKTAAYLGVKNPYDMAEAAEGATKYLAEGLNATGSAGGALAYYNSGRSRDIPSMAIHYANRGLQMYGGMPLIKNPTSGPNTSNAPSTDDIMKELGGGSSSAPSVASPSATKPTTSSPTPSSTSSSDPSTDDIMKELGGSTAPPTPTTQPPSVQPAPPTAAQPGATAPAQPDEPKTWGQIGKDIVGSAARTAGAGFKQGFADIDNHVSNWSTGVAQRVDESIPFLGKLDQAFGYNPKNDLQRQIGQQNAESAQFEKQYGTSPLATVGRFAGTTAALAPITVPLGALGATAGAAVKGVPLVGNLLQTGVRIGTGAAQGAAAAKIAGEDPMTGAIIGGAIPGGAAVIGGGARLAAATSKLAGTVLEHPLGQAGAAALTALIGGSLPHAALGSTGAHVVGWIARKYGSAIGQKAADVLAALSEKGLAAGVPGAAATYQRGNQLQPNSVSEVPQ